MLEKYEKQKELNENQDGKKEWEPSLKDILAKSEDSDLFGSLLDREDEKELAQKLSSGDLAQDDLNQLDKYRKDFLGIQEKVKVVKESITEDLVVSYTKNNPEMEKVASLIGIKAYTDIVKEKLAKLAIKDPSVFDELSKSVERKNDFKENQYNTLDKEITELCAKKKIKAEDYLKALAIEDDVKRSEALSEVVKKGYGGLRKAVDWLSAGQLTKSRSKLMGAKKEEIDEMLKDMDVHRSNVGGFLSGMVGNDEIRNALSKDLIGEKMERVSPQGFKEAKGQIPTKENLQTMWQEYKAGVGSWDKFGDPRKEKERDNFIKLQKEALAQSSQNKSGFWGSIFSIFFESFLTNNKNNLN